MRAPKPKVRLLAPVCVSRSQIGPTNHAYIVRNDLSVEAEEEDVPYLLRVGYRRDV